MASSHLQQYTTLSVNLFKSGYKFNVNVAFSSHIWHRHLIERAPLPLINSLIDRLIMEEENLSHQINQSYIWKDVHSVHKDDYFPSFCGNRCAANRWTWPVDWVILSKLETARWWPLYRSFSEAAGLTSVMMSPGSDSPFWGHRGDTRHVLFGLVAISDRLPSWYAWSQKVLKSQKVNYIKGRGIHN